LSTTKVPRSKRRSKESPQTVQDLVSEQVPSNRHEEIRRYLRLYGYNPERSILQVHLAGSFGRSMQRPREIASRERAASRYQGRTFTVLGRTHDPSFIKKLIPPRTQRSDGSNPGYLGYLWKNRTTSGRSPDELLPLDFVPASLRYPRDWKNLFNSPGYLVTMHVPSNFAKYKNNLNNRLRRIRGDVDVKKEWKFLDELSEYGYDTHQAESHETV
jgi:hypothetical protein